MVTEDALFFAVGILLIFLAGPFGVVAGVLLCMVTGISAIRRACKRSRGRQSPVDPVADLKRRAPPIVPRRHVVDPDTHASNMHTD